jgi:hypothetical protein
MSAGSGFCTIKSADYYEDLGEYDDAESATFSDVHEAFEGLTSNSYVPTDPGRADGIYRHSEAAEWMYAQIDKKPVRVLKKAKEMKVLTPTQERIMLMLTA